MRFLGLIQEALYLFLRKTPLFFRLYYSFQLIKIVIAWHIFKPVLPNSFKDLMWALKL